MDIIIYIYINKKCERRMGDAIASVGLKYPFGNNSDNGSQNTTGVTQMAALAQKLDRLLLADGSQSPPTSSLNALPKTPVMDSSLR
jgi:hypothetical protein